jgi:hypothetical protein
MLGIGCLGDDLSLLLAKLLHVTIAMQQYLITLISHHKPWL